MQFEFRVRHIDFERGLYSYLERRLRFALDRFADRVRRITVRINDLNVPRGDVDKQCRFQVALIPRGTVQLEETFSDVYQAVDRATHRLSSCVQRRLDRRREVFLR